MILLTLPLPLAWIVSKTPSHLTFPTQGFITVPSQFSSTKTGQRAKETSSRSLSQQIGTWPHLLPLAICSSFSTSSH